LDFNNGGIWNRICKQKTNNSAIMILIYHLAFPSVGSSMIKDSIINVFDAIDFF
jgi:hypothetical protein